VRARVIAGVTSGIVGCLLLVPDVMAQPGPAWPAVADAVWAAVRPALPYPPAAADDQPENGSAGPLWVVRRPRDDPAVAEVVANILNVENQARAEQAMAAIQQAVTAAELRAQTEFERLQARRSGSAEMRGISLDDEGVAGERADWDARLIIEARDRDDEYEFSLPGDVAPTLPAGPAGVALLVVAEPAEYEEIVDSGVTRRRYRPAEARLYVGGLSTPVVERRENGYRVRVGAAVMPSRGPGSVEVFLRGNRDLVRQVIDKADWMQVAALVK
jgi:hypothetical protein